MKTVRLVYVTAVDPRINGLIRGVGGPIMPIVRYFRNIVAETVIQYCINNTNAYTLYTNIIIPVVNVKGKDLPRTGHEGPEGE